VPAPKGVPHPSMRGNQYAKGNKGNGRPKKYPDPGVLVEKTKAYLESCQDKYEQELESENEKTGFVKYRTKLSVSIPTIHGLSLYLDLSKERIWTFSKKYKDFSNILEKMNNIQAQRLIEKSLSGEYNALIAKLILAKHGYKDNAEVEHRGKVIILDK